MEHNDGLNNSDTAFNNKGFWASLFWTVGVFIILIVEIRQFLTSEMSFWRVLKVVGNCGQMTGSIIFITLAVGYIKTSFKFRKTMRKMVKRQRNLFDDIKADVDVCRKSIEFLPLPSK